MAWVGKWVDCIAWRFSGVSWRGYVLVDLG